MEATSQREVISHEPARCETAPALVVARTMPALGAFREQADEARRRARWLMQCSLAEHHARWVALPKIIRIYEALRLGRRLDLIARDLRTLAADLEATASEINLTWDAA